MMPIDSSSVASAGGTMPPSTTAMSSSAPCSRRPSRICLARSRWDPDSTEAPIDKLDLDHIDAVLTCSRLGISISGTIVLDGEADQGRRAITLVPDKHVCVLERESVVPTVPQAVDVLGEHPERPMTWIAGPSATSDIELVRVNGVHGPRHLAVVIAH